MWSEEANIREVISTLETETDQPRTEKKEIRWYYGDQLFPRLAMENFLQKSVWKTISASIDDLEKSMSVDRPVDIEFGCSVLKFSNQVEAVNFLRKQADAKGSEIKLKLLIKPEKIEIFSSRSEAVQFLKVKACHGCEDDATHNAWNLENTQKLGHKEQVHGFPLLEDINSVQAAVEILNAEPEKCSGGICLAYSENQKAYFLLWRTDQCIRALEAALPTWSIKNTQKLDHKERVQGFPLLENINSVAGAVSVLNAEPGKCSEGICMVYSENQGAYFLLWRTDRSIHALQALFPSGQNDGETPDRVCSETDTHWSTERAKKLEHKEQVQGVPLLENINSVRTAVDVLNAEPGKCFDGICLVYSESQKAYFLLWHTDLCTRVDKLVA